MTVAGVAALPSNLALRSRGALLSLVVDAVLLCFATQSLQIAAEWLRQRLDSAAAACVTLLSFVAESRKSYCSGCMKLANDALAPNVSAF